MLQYGVVQYHHSGFADRPPVDFRMQARCCPGGRAPHRSVAAPLPRAVLAQFRQQRRRIIGHPGARRRQRRIEPDAQRASRLLPLPNSAVPTRTQVAPSSMAVSRSCDMPIESSVKPCSAASSRSLPEIRPREASGSSLHGGMVIRPRSRQVRAAADGRDQRGQFGGIDAALGLFRGELDFQHDFSGVPASFRRRAEFRRIHRLDHLEQFRRLLRLVGLQMADQVKSRAVQVRRLRAICPRTPARNSRRTRAVPGRSLADRGGRKYFGDRQQQDPRRVAARPLRGPLDPQSNGG